MIDLCCGTLDRPTQSNGSSAVEAGKSSQGYLSYLNRTSSAASAPSAPSAPSAQMDRRSGASDLARAAIANDQENRRSGIYRHGSQTDTPLPPDTDTLPPSIPKLRQFFAFFVDHPQYFIRFLETVAERRWAQTLQVAPAPKVNGNGAPSRADDLTEEEEDDQEAVWSTLLDLYLQTSAGQIDQAMRQKALALLHAHDRLRYEPTQALIVCVTYNFVPGMIYLYEKLGMVDDVMRFWIEQAQSPDATAAEKSEASRNAIATLRKHGPAAPYLYSVALRFLTSSADILDRHHSDLAEILEHIEDEKILPPIAVVQILSRSGVASVGTVKAYLLKQITTERQEIDSVSQDTDLALRRDGLTLCAGSRPHPVVSQRVRQEASRDQGAFRSQSAEDLPGHTMFGLWRSAGSAGCALHVQAQLPPTVRAVFLGKVRPLIASSQVPRQRSRVSELRPIARRHPRHPPKQRKAR